MFWQPAPAGAGQLRFAVVDSGIEDGHPRVGAVQGGVALDYDADAPGRDRKSVV